MTKSNPPSKPKNESTKPQKKRTQNSKDVESEQNVKERTQNSKDVDFEHSHPVMANVIVPIAGAILPTVIDQIGKTVRGSGTDPNLVTQIGDLSRRLFEEQEKHVRFVKDTKDKLSSLEQEGLASDRKAKHLQKLLQEANEKEAVRLAELEKLRNYPPASFQLKEYWNRPNSIHIGVLGGSGSGKSTFINTARGIRKQDPGAANVSHGIECTMEVAPHGHAVEHEGKTYNIVYWDLPGWGTERFPTKTYLRDFGVRHFNFVILLTVSRFKAGDLLILNEMKEHNVPHASVRNKIDQAIQSAVMEGDDVDAMMDEIRRDFKDVGVERVFLISSPLIQFDKYDFPELREYMRKCTKVNIDEGIDYRVPQDFQQNEAPALLLSSISAGDEDALAGATIPETSDHKPCATCTIL